MAALLVVEDEEKIGQLLVSALEANGHRVTWTRTGTEALDSIRSGAFELAFVDLGLMQGTHAPGVLMSVVLQEQAPQPRLGAEPMVADGLCRPDLGYYGGAAPSQERRTTRSAPPGGVGRAPDAR